ncbi:class I adenylate-forming enzyme family protein [Streptomonospora litoralis]|uniref:Short-chain-fatty-acid--CoA ligase n=1 Tax=Streptomonospora litoralis TaxID=2498135 RepID=A0A4P6Q4K5_9ACTN|nr:class I adenylate-forming enzyme family protein [Streptomonospora litoralis]QBI55523.1 Short-chain-fatty-acid--CoA ligase [Streptomonospora litoralis]
MTTAWTSNNGIVLADLVPAELRRTWVEHGHCPDTDLYTLFRGRVRDHPRRDAVVDGEGTLDYAALDTRVRRIAAALADSGIGPRDIVAVQLPNGWRAVAAELAIAAVGAVSLPYPAMRGRAGIAALLRRSRAVAVIAGDPTGRTHPLAELARLRPELPHLAAVFSFGDDRAPATATAALDAAAGAEHADRREWPPRRVPPESPARILVTSGSESEPKMIAYSHNAFAGGRANYVAALHDGTMPMRNLVLVPLASSYGSLGTPVTLAGLGGTLLVLDGVDPAAVLRAVSEHRPTHLFAVPTLLRRLAAHPGAVGEDTSSLRAVVTSSAVLEADVIDAAHRRFGRPVLNVYGSADGMNCHTPLGASARPGGVTGRPDPAVADIRIVGTGDGDGDGDRDGEGEIWARGPMTPLCYVDAPELDARYRAEGGWVRSGDRGRFEEDGALRVIDRLKRVVKRGGYTISPREVEGHLAAHPAVAEAVCVGVPDPVLGERLCACVVQAPGTEPLTPAALHAFLEDARGLERAKLPEVLLRLAELPLGATGKVCRHTLAEWGAESGERSAPPAAAASEPGPLRSRLREGS